MTGFEQIGRWLIIIGVLLIIFGALFLMAGRFSWLSWFGRLPGDIKIRGKHYAVYIPIVTSIVLSLILTLLLNLIFWLKH